jgi:precorrin-4 methylase
MVGPNFDTSQAAAPFLAIRPSLHSVEDIVRALMPYYGPNHPIVAISTEAINSESYIEATLSSIADILIEKAAFSRPILVIR